MCLPHRVQATGALWRYTVAADSYQSNIMISTKYEESVWSTDQSPNGANHGTVTVNIGGINEPRS